MKKEITDIVMSLNRMSIYGVSLSIYDIEFDKNDECTFRIWYETKFTNINQLLLASKYNVTQEIINYITPQLDKYDIDLRISLSDDGKKWRIKNKNKKVASIDLTENEACTLYSILRRVSFHDKLTKKQYSDSICRKLTNSLNDNNIYSIRDTDVYESISYLKKG